MLDASQPPALKGKTLVTAYPLDSPPPCMLLDTQPVCMQQNGTVLAVYTAQMGKSWSSSGALVDGNYDFLLSNVTGVCVQTLSPECMMRSGLLACMNTYEQQFERCRAQAGLAKCILDYGAVIAAAALAPTPAPSLAALGSAAALGGQGPPAGSSGPPLQIILPCVLGGEWSLDGGAWPHIPDALP